jgi:hypothetical protein
MQHNAARINPNVTHGGAPAFPKLSALQSLRRSVLSCLLWESEFYESGESIVDRIVGLCAQVVPEDLAKLAIEARTEHNLRHVSLLLLVELAKHGRGHNCVSYAIEKTIQRADELGEFVSLYWRKGKVPLSKQVKKGLAAALRKFDAYQLAKYDREKAVRIRDVLFLVHAKPKDDAQAAIWKQLVDGTLPAPDTWEVALSTGGNKCESFTRLLTEGKLGYLALLRNLRGMADAGVNTDLIRDAILARKGGAERVLPFRYVAAARACPRFEPALDQALSEAISALPPLTGRTLVLVDVSGSMNDRLSSKSDLKRIDAACALASLINGDVRMFSFSTNVVEVPPRRGMAGVDALIKSQIHSNTHLAEAVVHMNHLPHDRLIVITDEQATTGGIPAPVAKHAYMINVASYKNGVGYGKWTHIDGFSESVLRWIHETEQLGDDNR